MKNVFWIDLEMTGLDVDKEVIIEVGAIVTDLNFRELDSYHAVIKQPQKYIDAMDEWNTEHHGNSGLIDQIPHGKPIDVVEIDLMNMCETYFDKEPAIIAGNSISNDRKFINKYMKGFAEKLHHRMIDVTSYKLIFNHKYDIQYEKQNNHRALDDIQESINELKHYLEYLHL